MNNYQFIDTAIYNNSEQTNIVGKRKGILIPIVYILLGISVVAMGYMIEVIKDNANLWSAFLMIGIAVVSVGLIRLFIAALGKKRIPIYAPTKERLKRYELYFDILQKEKVLISVRKGDFETLWKMPRNESSAIMVIVYKPASGDILFSQILEFVPHFHKPITETIIFRKGEYKMDAI